MIAIPAIDLIDNQVVRLYQGDYGQQTNYALDPISYAKEIAKNNLEYLHLVDLSGAKIGKLVHTQLMKDLVQETGLKVDFGGGIQTEQDLQELIEAGANQVVIGSLCVKQTDQVYNWIRKYGIERFVLALDTDGTQLKIKGWQEGSGVSLEDLMERFKGLKGLTILTTDIRRDGTGKGPSLELYTSLVKQYPDQRWIASGGVETLADLQELREAGCYGCVVGKALLEGKITLNELKEFNNGSV